MAPVTSIFVPSSVVDHWVTDGRVELGDGFLRAQKGGRAYSVVEAVRILSEVTGAPDAHGWVGQVWEVAALSARGAEVVDRSVIMGELAYDAVPGFVLAPEGPGTDARTVLRALAALSGPPRSGQSDEELLARYLIEKLE